MEDNKFGKLLAPLRKEQEELNAKKLQLTTELNSISSSLKQLDSAISALTGKSAKKQTVKRKQQKPAATKQVVQEQVQALLATDKSLSMDALKDGVSRKLDSLGYSQMGFSLRFKEATASKSID